MKRVKYKFADGTVHELSYEKVLEIERDQLTALLRSKAQTQKAQAKRGGAKREGSRDPIREEVKGLFRSFPIAGTTLAQLLQALEKDPQNGLKIKQETAGRYSVSRADGSCKSFSLKTLSTIWTEAHTKSR